MTDEGFSDGPAVEAVFSAGGGLLLVLDRGDFELDLLRLTDGSGNDLAAETFRRGTSDVACRLRSVKSGRHRLLIHYEGDVIWKGWTYFNRTAGELDEVGGGRARGWVILASADDRIDLFIDGVIRVRIVPDHLRADLAFLSNSRGMDGFDVILPSDVFDGEVHSFELRCGGKPVGMRREWKADYRLRIERADGYVLAGWCFDPVAPHISVDLIVRLDGAKDVPLRCKPRVDVADAFGASAAGIDLGFGSEPSLIEICYPGGIYGLKGGSFFPKGAQTAITSIQDLISDLRVSPRPAAQNELVMDALGVALKDARARVAETRPVQHLVSLSGRSASAGRAAVIVPIYLGLEETRACIQSVLRSVPPGTPLVLVNDSTPDLSLGEFCRSTAQENSQVTLIENDNNLGFPGSVNRGLLEFGRQMDCVVLNSDTVVPLGWLERLLYWAAARPNVASVTPFTNSGTIMSYPIANFDNVCSEEEAADYDHLFRAVGRIVEEVDVVELPTAVGFCMLMTNRAIQEVGLLGEEWGRGYAEEVDWSIRAKDRGFRHVAATDLYILHRGSVSFGTELRNELSERNNRVLRSRYPEYLPGVRAFINLDPLCPAKLRADRMRFGSEKDNILLHLSGGSGGGTDKYIADVSKLASDRGFVCYGIIPNKRAGPWAPSIERSFSLGGGTGTMSAFLSVKDVIAFLASRPGRGGDVLHLHSTLGYAPRDIDRIVRAARRFGWYMVASVHDYAWICPRIRLLRSNDSFCGVPSIATCDWCVAEAPMPDEVHQDALTGGVSVWVGVHERILTQMHRVVAPSRSAIDLIQKRFPNLDISLAAHFDLNEETRVRELGPVLDNRIVRLALVGAIGVHKGLNLLKSLMRGIARENLPIEMVVLGYTADDAGLRQEFPGLAITGPYSSEDVVDHLRGLSVDAVLNLSIWPETYCYTVSEAWKAGCPVISLKLGAQAERIELTGAGWVVPEEVSVHELASELWRHLRTTAIGGVTVRPTDRGLYFDELYGPASLDRSASSKEAATTRYR